MSKHTPGPWVYCTRLSGSENHKGFYIKAQRFVVAYEVIPVDSDGKEGRANARLIAAAPELLEALEAFLASYLRGANSGDWGFWNPEEEEEVIAVRAAIAKVRP